MSEKVAAWLDSDTARRLDALKIIPRESRQRVVVRLLEEHDKLASLIATSSSAIHPDLRERSK